MEGQLKNGTILTSESGNKYTVVPVDKVKSMMWNVMESIMR